MNYDISRNALYEKDKYKRSNPQKTNNYSPKFEFRTTKYNNSVSLQKSKFYLN